MRANRSPIRAWGWLAILVASTVLGTDQACVAAQSRDVWQKPDRVIKDLGLLPGMAVADIGCGDGYSTFRLAAAVGPQGKVFAVDINQKALDAVKKKAIQRGLSNISLVHSQPTDTKLKEGSIDVALLSMVLHHVPEKQRQPLLASIANSLKPAGELFVIDLRKVEKQIFHRYEELVAREEVIQAATAVGLTVDTEYLYLPHQYFLRFRKALEP